jgi:hypothetical protein
MNTLRRFVLALALLFPQVALAQIYPTSWYFSVTDSTPSTTVWNTATGAFVSNTGGAYQTWLSAIVGQVGSGAGLASPISNVTNNGSGLVRITVANPFFVGSNWRTGQYKTVFGVGGATGANGVCLLTVISSTQVDCQGSTFGGTYTSGGTIGAGPVIDTAANLNILINQYNLSQVSQLSTIPLTILATATLSNPVYTTQFVTIAAGAQTVTMPQANLFGSIPIGYQIKFHSTGPSIWTLKDSSGGTIVAVPAGWSVLLALVDNSTAAGSYVYELVPTAQLLCSQLSGAAASCSTDATNASNISSGTLGAGRLPTQINAAYGPSFGQLRYALTGVNFNSANTDNALTITLPTGVTRYAVAGVRINNASASISTATIGVFTSTGGGGQTIAANQAITVTATATDTNNNTMSLTLTNGNTMAYNDATLQVRIGTAQGSAATADVIVDIIPLS